MVQALVKNRVAFRAAFVQARANRFTFCIFILCSGLSLDIFIWINKIGNRAYWMEQVVLGFGLL